MRYEPDDPTLAGNFIEFSDSWSRAQVRAAWATIPDANTAQAADTEGRLLDCLRPKIVTLHLDCVDTAPITDPADLTTERTDEIDERLYKWFAYVWMKHLGELSKLGEAVGRRLWLTSATSSSNGATKPENKAQPTARRRSRKS